MASAPQGKRKRLNGDEASHGATRPRFEEYSKEEVEDDEVDMALLEAVERDAEAVEVMDVRGLKKLVLAFEKRLRDNLAARMKYADNPEKFMESEVELDEEVKRLTQLSATPDLYPELVRLNSVPSILGLLTHENTDISIDVVNLLQELTDGDVIGDYEEEAMVLIDALLEGNVLEMVSQNLTRMDEADNEEAGAVHGSLSIIENLVESRPVVADTVGEKTKLLGWLLKRITKREFDSNKLYASEVLAILLQSSLANQKRVGQLNGVDTLLQAVAQYKTREPKSAEEEELVENCFDSLCSALMPPENKERFVKAEGVELMIIICKQKRVAYSSAVKALDFALTRCPAACERFVDVLGLKTLFSAFMGKAPLMRKDAAEAAQLQEEVEERVISVVASLFGGLARGPRRERLVSKFTENEFEKTDRLMEFYLKYSDRVLDESRRQAVGKQQREEEIQMDAEDRQLALLSAGLYTLQLLALVTAHIWAADPLGFQDRFDLLLKQQKMLRGDVVCVLEEYRDSIGDADGEEERDKRRGRVDKLITQMK